MANIRDLQNKIRNLKNYKDNLINDSEYCILVDNKIVDEKKLTQLNKSANNNINTLESIEKAVNERKERESMIIN